MIIMKAVNLKTEYLVNPKDETATHSTARITVTVMVKLLKVRIFTFPAIPFISSSIDTIPLQKYNAINILPLKYVTYKI